MNQLSSTEQTSDEIDLHALFCNIWQNKLSVFVTVILFTLTSIFYSLSLSDTYKSETLLAPVSDSSQLNVPSQLGGLAALAGVNIGGGGGEKTALALELLKSREFIGRFINKYDLYVPLMAAKDWEMESNHLILDSEKYNSNTKEWVRVVKLPYKAKPSSQEAFEQFKKIFSVSQEKTSGVVTLTLEFYSPYLAKYWLDKLVEMINEEMRQRDLIEAEQSIAYLNAQISQTNLADLRATLYTLIEEQTKTLMLANVRKEYVFKTIDPPVVTEKKNGPKRSLIVFAATLLGLICSILVVVFRRRERTIIN